MAQANDMRSDHGGTRPSAHALCLHSGGESCTAALRAFLGAAGEGPILAVVSPATYSLVSEVTGPSATYEDATVLGRNPARVIPAIRKFVEDNASGGSVKVVTEQWWDQRELAERAELARHEALSNLAFEGIDVALVCLYDTRRVRPEIVADAVHTHPLLCDENGVRPNPEYVDPEVVLDLTESSLQGSPSTAEAFAVRPGDLHGLRTAAEERGYSAGLPEERVDDLVLAVNELATNVVSHGGGTGLMRIWTEDRWLVCEVLDRGHVDDPLAGTRVPPLEDTGGRGLWIVNQLCDLVELRSNPTGTAVRLRFARPRSVTAAKSPQWC